VPQNDPSSASTEDFWRNLMGGPASMLKRSRHLFQFFPGAPRCRMCQFPLGGSGGLVARWLFRRKPSNLNPRLCSMCDYIAEHYPGGAEVELSLLFADVRGSTRLAEQMSPAAFARLMDRFYTVATDVAVRTDALIEKFVGDEVAALYTPGIAGPDHARLAVEGARHLLEVTGHRDPDGPWLPMGAGVHTGVSFVGSVGSGGIHQITALGDAANTAARLASTAQTGEILISQAAYRAAGVDHGPLEQRDLMLKGRSAPIRVHVLRVAAEGYDESSQAASA
jgi:adenylate cyclase